MTNRDTYDIEEAQKIEQYEARQKELYEKLIEITKWHAQLQIDFERELLQDLEVLN